MVTALGGPGAAAGSPRGRRGRPHRRLPVIDRPLALSGRDVAPGTDPGPHAQGADGGRALPRNADKRRHLKLGRGSLSDVEWTVQLMQLEHGHELAGLRTTSTLGALEAATEAGLLSAEDSAQLAAAWTMATEVRSAVMLFRGRTAEALPV